MPLYTHNKWVLRTFKSFNYAIASEEYFLQIHCVAPGDSGPLIVRLVIVEVIEYYARPYHSTSRLYSTKMLYRFLADTVVLIHMLFVVYAIAGGLLVLKWKFTIFLHIPALLWATVVEAAGWICPLTPLENRLRVEAGQAGYSGGFVENYLLPTLYPGSLTRLDQVVLALCLVTVNVVIYVIVARRLLRRRATD